MSFLKMLVTWWDVPTFGTWLTTRLSGVEVGRDDEGNVYYTSKKGDRRWVIYARENEASRVAPEWHAWLHRQVADAPSEKPLPRKAWERDWTPNATGTAAAHAPSGALQMGGRRAKATGDYEAWTPD